MSLRQCGFDIIAGVNGVLGAESRPCSAQCTDADGCWGPDDSHCRRCANYRLFDGRCVAACNTSLLALDADEDTTRSLYVGNVTKDGEERQCRHCHPQCNGTCVGDVRILNGTWLLVHPVRSSGQILLPRYLMNASNKMGEPCKNSQTDRDAVWGTGSYGY